MTLDPSPASVFLRALPGQEFSTLRGNFVESNESDTAEKSAVWPLPSLEEEKIGFSASRRHGSENWMSRGRQEPTYADLLSGFGASAGSSHGTCAPLNDHAAVAVDFPRKQSLDEEGKFNLLASPWSLMPSNLSLNLSDKGPVQGGDVAYQAPGDARHGATTEYSMIHCHRAEHPRGNWLMPSPSTRQFGNSAHSREPMPKPVLVQQFEAVKPKDGNYKLFGIPLICNPSIPESAAPRRGLMNEPAGHILDTSHLAHTLDSDQKSEQSRGSKSADNPLPVIKKMLVQRREQHSRELQGKILNSPTRSCTKVFFSS